ncbi:MAG TPA: hypothetical protein VM940_08050 [Chthoniobacterales bacterium]|jgi:hypothetical protein|nr:hypothetical protein [Chthoniobacterales bacterium]
MNSQPVSIVAVSIFFVVTQMTFANGGAWQTGVPVTGNAAATDQKKSTNVTIEEENLTIDLHQEFAAVEVRYRMKNTGGQVEQDFFFPVERWAESDSEADPTTPSDLEGYAISADGAELKVQTVNAKGEQPKPEKDRNGEDYSAGRRLWKKSSIPFAQGQTREVLIRYRSPYAANQSSVSEDFHSEASYFRYSLSPAATWKGPIGKGTITVNYLHPLPEDISIVTPKDRFKKINDTQFVWEFENLKPTLADDLKIISHPAYEAYEMRREEGAEAQKPVPQVDYVIQGDRYFLQHTDYEATASSTLKPNGDRTYDVDNIKVKYSDKTWAEGVDGDGIGESITLKVRRSLPLHAIMIMPGYFSRENQALWGKNNRVAELEVTLNDEHTFSAKIPDEKLSADYPIPVRNYAKPVNTVKLTIKGVHKGTSARDTCISALTLRSKLSEKPKVTPAR